MTAHTNGSASDRMKCSSAREVASSMEPTQGVQATLEFTTGNGRHTAGQTNNRSPQHHIQPTQPLFHGLGPPDRPGLLVPVCAPSEDQKREGTGIIFGGSLSPSPPLESSCRREPNLLQCLAPPPYALPDRASGGFIIPYRNLPCAAPPKGARGARASEVGIALDEKRFVTPPNIAARPSTSGARSRSYTRGSEIAGRTRRGP